MTTIGVDRLFSSWITGGGIPYQILPMLAFLIAIFVGIATGTSWGTMAILFPLLLVPTYEASGGEPEIFYATVSAILGGAVAGDHISPISDTTVLTAIACDVNLMVSIFTIIYLMFEGSKEWVSPMEVSLLSSVSNNMTWIVVVFTMGQSQPSCSFQKPQLISLCVRAFLPFQNHVNTQAPYVFWVVLFATLFGYIPIGYSAYPNIVGILLGWVSCALFVYFICVPVLSPTGQWDFITRLCCGRSKELQDLASDCAKKAKGDSLDRSENEKDVGVQSSAAESANDEVPTKGDK